MDNEPKPSMRKAQSAAELFSSAEFLLRVKEMESELAKALHDQSLFVDLAFEFESELEERLAGLQTESKVTVSGRIYRTDDSGEPNGDRVDLTDWTVVYIRPEIVHIEGLPRITMGLSHYTGTFDEDGPIEDYAYMRPAEITHIEIHEKAEADKTVEDFLRDFAEESRELTSSHGFLIAEPGVQREILSAFEKRVSSKVKEFFEGQVWSIDTKKFMSEYSDLVFPVFPMSLRETFVDQTHEPVSEQFSPVGKYVRISFAELRTTNSPALDSIRSPEDFSLAGGVPCILIQNKDFGVIYLIPIDEVNDHVAVYQRTSDE